MADYIEILDTQIEPDAPLTAALAAQFRDNPEAIAEGAAGAPRINPIAAMAHNGAAGAVGTYAMLRTEEISGQPALAHGETRAGSSLRYANAVGFVSGTPSGTWRLMGYLNNTGVDQNEPGLRTSIWLRIS